MVGRVPSFEAAFGEPGGGTGLAGPEVCLR